MGSAGTDWYFAKKTGPNRDTLIGRIAAELVDDVR